MKKKSQMGFTLIEIIVVIILTGILGNTILIATYTATRSTPAILKTAIALQTAKRCMEWFIGQQRFLGYTSTTCPSTTVPAFCTAPAGYTLTVDIDCTTIAGDANYKTVTVNVTGDGIATLVTLLGNY